MAVEASRKRSRALSAKANEDTYVRVYARRAHKANKDTYPRREALVQVEKLCKDDLQFNLGEHAQSECGLKGQLAQRLIDAIDANKVCSSPTGTA